MGRYEAPHPDLPLNASGHPSPARGEGEFAAYSVITASRKYGTLSVERQKPVTLGLIIM